MYYYLQNNFILSLFFSFSLSSSSIINPSLTHDIISRSKIAVLVDDGAATGATLIAAARWIKNKNLPIQLIIVTTVAPKYVVSLHMYIGTFFDCEISAFGSSFLDIRTSRLTIHLRLVQ